MNSFTHPENDPRTDPAGQPGQTQAPAPLVHPGWCDQRSCRAAVGDPHCGRPSVISGDRVGSAELHLRLWSPSDDIVALVLVELVARDCDSGRRLRVDLSMRQLYQLRDHLAALIEHTGVRRRRWPWHSGTG